jgi:hypothetical protein
MNVCVLKVVSWMPTMGAIGGRDLLDPQIKGRGQASYIPSLQSSSWVGFEKCFWNFELLLFMHSTIFFIVLLLNAIISIATRNKKNRHGQKQMGAC